jgi:hypothetical protein
MKILEPTAQSPAPDPAMGEMAPDFEVVEALLDCTVAADGDDVVVPFGVAVVLVVET